MRPSHGHCAAITILVDKALGALLLNSEVVAIIYAHLEVVQRERTEIAKEDRYPTLRADVFVLYSNLKKGVLEQDTRGGRAQIRERLSHCWNDLLRNALRRHRRWFFLR